MLIAYNCLFDAYNFANFSMRYFICGYDLDPYLDKVFANTVQYPFNYFKCGLLNRCNLQERIDYYAVHGMFPRTGYARMSYWYLTTQTCIFISLLLNLFIVLDLYFMMNNPFQNNSSRPKKFFVLSLTLGVLFAGVCLYETHSGYDYFLSHIKVEHLFLTIMLTNVITAGIVLSVVLYRLNNRGGTSVEIKRQVSKRYMEFVFIFIFLHFLCNQQQRPYFSFEPTAAWYEAGTIYSRGWRIAISGVGVIMALSRLRDPLILAKFKEMFYIVSLQGQKARGLVEIEAKKSNLNSQFQSTLNTELIICVLKGITILAASSSDNADNIADSDMLQVKQTVTIEIAKFKIKDADNFDITKKVEEEVKEAVKEESTQRKSFMALRNYNTSKEEDHEPSFGGSQFGGYQMQDSFVDAKLSMRPSMKESMIDDSSAVAQLTILEEDSDEEE
jgi:hypothetical protein